MKHFSTKAGILVALSFCTAVAAHNCFDIIESVCGAGQLYPCASFCATSPIECKSSGVTERISVRDKEVCQSALGNTWQNCDDREEKTKCTEVLECSVLSSVVCPDDPTKWACVGGGDVVSSTVYWTVIATVSCHPH